MPDCRSGGRTIALRAANHRRRTARAAFHYVPTGETVRPVDLMDAAGLTALIEAVQPGP